MMPFITIHSGTQFTAVYYRKKRLKYEQDGNREATCKSTFQQYTTCSVLFCINKQPMGTDAQLAARPINPSKVAHIAQAAGL